MAHVLNITDGTNTVKLGGGDNISLVKYDPLSSLDGSIISERADINFTSTAAANTTNLQKLNRLFEQARNYARTQTGARVYLNFDPGTSGTVYRSMISNGKVNLNPEVLGPLYTLTFNASIEWTREPFWEGPLTAVPLTNNSATDDVAGITITNRDDDGTCQVETATIVGTITGSGNATVTSTVTGMAGSPLATSVGVLDEDTPTEVATKMATALNLVAAITALYNVSSSGATLIYTRLIPAANDTGLNIAYTNDTCTGLTPDATSVDTTAGSTTPHENWVSIKAANVVGDLPAPIKLQMYNATDDDAQDEIWLHHNVYSTPASLDHVLEGEAATGATVTSTASGTSSSGFYGSLAWTATTETLIATWALTTGELSYMAGGRFGVLVRWVTAFPYNGDTWLRLKLTATTTNTVLWEGNLSIIPDNTRGLHLLDVLRLPPFLQGQAALKGINLKLYALRNESGTHTIPLDYLQLSPISGDSGWKRFLSVETGTAGAAYQEYLTHDDTEGWTYRTDTSSKIISEFVDYGGPVLLIPNAVQNLYFVSCDFNGLSKVDQSWTVKLWYRPRRNAL